MATNHYYLSVLHYPHNDNGLNNTINILNKFIISLNKKFNINLRFRASSTLNLNSELHNLIHEFLSFSERHLNYVDINHISDLFHIIKYPNEKMLNTILLSYKNNNELCQFFQNTRRTAKNLNINEVFQFISLKKT